MKEFKVGIIGATGMVGQRFVSLFGKSSLVSSGGFGGLIPFRGKDL